MNSEQSLSNVSKNLNKLTNKELLKTKWALEKFLYKAGTNVAIHNAAKQREYQFFEGAMDDAIRAMLLKVAREDYLKDITMDLRKINDKDIWERTIRVFASLGISLNDFFRGGQKGIENFILWAAKFGGQSTLDKWRVDAIFNVQNPKLVEVLKDRSTYLINSVDDTTKKWLADLISKAKEERLTNAEIAELIRDKAPEISKVRAALIAETEVANAIGIVEMQTSLKNGLKKWRWVTSRDDRVDYICLANEAAGYVEIGKSFPSGDAHVPSHPRCRCYMDEEIPVAFDYEGRTYWVGQDGEVYSVPTL